MKTTIGILREGFNNLILFKNDKDFHNLGFSVASPHHKWRKELILISLDKEEPSKNRKLARILLLLGLEYMINKGQDSKLALRHSETLRAGLDI